MSDSQQNKPLQGSDSEKCKTRIDKAGFYSCLVNPVDCEQLVKIGWEAYCCHPDAKKFQEIR